MPVTEVLVIVPYFNFNVGFLDLEWVKIERNLWKNCKDKNIHQREFIFLISFFNTLRA